MLRVVARLARGSQGHDSQARVPARVRFNVRRNACGGGELHPTLGTATRISVLPPRLSVLSSSALCVDEEAHGVRGGVCVTLYKF